jgi:hypothetical protein
MPNAKFYIKHSIHAIILAAALVFLAKFAGPNLLRQYISYGIGDCRSVPIICMQPEEKIFTPQINKEYLNTLIPYEFNRMQIAAPKDFMVTHELITRYYKKKHPSGKSIIYLLIQEPGAFIKLYPQVKKQGVKDNYEFIRRLMYARLDQVKNLGDAFFVIMKSIFTPDIGCQSTAKMIKFDIKDYKGFINYQMCNTGNFFDCNAFDQDGNFFKVYIKDYGAQLDLNNVFAIISTLKPVN